MSIQTRTPVDTDQFWTGMLVGGVLTIMAVVAGLFALFTFSVAGGAF